MKIFEIRELSDQELRKRIQDEEENLAHLRFQHETTRLESPAKLQTVRRDIARMKTVLRERELKIERSKQPSPTPQAENQEKK